MCLVGRFTGSHQKLLCPYLVMTLHWSAVLPHSFDFTVFYYKLHSSEAGWRTYSRIAEVVKAVVVQYKPPALPILDSATCKQHESQHKTEDEEEKTNINKQIYKINKNAIQRRQVSTVINTRILTTLCGTFNSKVILQNKVVCSILNKTSERYNSTSAHYHRKVTWWIMKEALMTLARKTHYTHHYKFRRHSYLAWRANLLSPDWRTYASDHFRRPRES